MEAWNIFFAICIDHTRFRAVELASYQCIITSASTQYPPMAWLNYDVQFYTLAASDPSIRWDKCHTDLWLQCMSTSKSTQSPRWLCKHCGATNHYPDHYPFRPNPLPAFTGGQQVNTRGVPNTGHPRHAICRDFNCYSCRRPDCKFDHHWGQPCW